MKVLLFNVVREKRGRFFFFCDVFFCCFFKNEEKIKKSFIRCTSAFCLVTFCKTVF